MSYYDHAVMLTLRLGPWASEVRRRKHGDRPVRGDDHLGRPWVKSRFGK